MRRVEEVGGIGAELQNETLRDFECPEQAKVHVYRTWPQERVTADVSIRIFGWIREYARIIEWVATADSTEFLGRTALVGCFPLAHGI